MGNTFSYIGRFIDAIKMFDEALKIIPNFPMAIGNKGTSLFYYGKESANKNHQAILLHKSHSYLKRSLEFPSLLEGDAEQGFKAIRDVITQILSSDFISSELILNEHELPTDVETKKYQEWCLRNGLYLNPINDLGPYTYSSQDDIHVKSLIIPVKKPPVIMDYINLIKQEYCSSRYLYYQYKNTTLDGIADLDILKFDTYQDIKLSHNTELLKFSFRGFYSILDKISYAINKYYELGIPDSKVSFRTIWFERDGKTLKEFFVDTKNWPLRGIFWVSRDFFEKKDDFQLELEPEAKELAEIRNFVEHKSLKILNYNPLLGPLPMYEEDDLSSYSITEDDLSSKVIKLGHLVRSAIIYLIYSIDQNEKGKSTDDSIKIDLK